MIIKRKLFVDASYKNRKQKREADKRKKEQLINKRSKQLKKVYKDIENINGVKNPQVESNIIKSRTDVIVSKDPTQRIINDTDDPRFKKKLDNVAGVVTNKNSLRNISRNLGFETRNKPDTDLVKNKRALKEEIDDSLDTNKHFVRYPKDAGIDTLSHEFGHLKNIDDGYPKRLEEGQEFNPREELRDERKASKNAIGILKKAGASKKEIKQSKKNLRTFEKTYRLTSKGAKEERRRK